MKIMLWLFLAAGLLVASFPNAQGDTEYVACWKKSYGRGAGVPLSACKSGQYKSGLLCYPNCKPGYYGVGPVCWGYCPSGYTDTGALCQANTYGKGCCCTIWGCCGCDSGYTDMGCFCQTSGAWTIAKSSYGNGAGYPMVCKSYEEQWGALCYPKCKAGYYGVGPVCWQKCPNQLHTHDCNALCSDNSGTCTQVSTHLGLIGFGILLSGQQQDPELAADMAKEAQDVLEDIGMCADPYVPPPTENSEWTDYSGYLAYFEQTKGAYLPGDNVETLSMVSAGKCAAACLSRWWCRSFDFYHAGLGSWALYGKCYLSSKGEIDVALTKNIFFPTDDYFELKTMKDVKVYVNQAIPGHNRETLSGRTPSDCAEACRSRAWCKSFDYHNGKSVCDLCDKSYLEVPLGSNTGAYNHYYLPITDFALRKNAAIPGHNSKTLNNKDASECASECMKLSYCKSFDYNRAERWCDLSDKHAAEVGGLRTDYPGHPYDHYSFSLKRFKFTKNAAISGHNIENLRDVNPVDCAEACLYRTWCKSFDYQRVDRWCDLSDKIASEVGS